MLNTLRVLKRSAAEVIAEVEGVPDDVTGTATRMLSDRLDETTVEISELLEQAAEREAAESQRELRQLGAIAQITAAAVSSLDVRRVFEAVAPQLPRLFKFDRLILGLVTSSGDALRLAAVWPPAEALREGTVLPLRQSALGHPILDHGPFIVSDVEKAPAFAERDLLLSDGIRSLIAMPLLARDKPLGALCLLSRAPAAYSTSDIAALRGVAGQLTTAFVCADLLDTERKRSAELHVVNEVAKKALTAADVGDILQAVTASIQKHFAYYDVSLFLLEAERRELALAAGAGAYSRSLSPGYRQPLGVGVIGLVAQSGESLMINDVTKEPRRVLAFPGETTTGSELCVPIKLRGEVLGVINVECERTDAFDQDDLTAMETIADEIAQVVETVRLRAGQR
ncbi:MAG: GAF domain-containing protein, partial [Planctomycetes bacterium]|nr:GAF domain-containing protein [Planctomycetota bacterium]